jgi:plasmid stabilization system protein ParE
VKLVWSAFALADRNGIFTHIEADNPRAAVAVDERIAAFARRLSRFPGERTFRARRRYT